MKLAMTPVKRNGFASVSFDYIRFIAALAVVLGHAVTRFFGPYSDVIDPSLSEKVFRVVFSGYGAQAVMVFFVLSGLFIGQSVLSQLQRDKFAFRQYALRRLIRLWLVLIPALFLTYVVDSFGITYLSHDLIYQASGMFGSVNPEDLSFPVFLSNAFFLQTIVNPTYGSNGALWSLANEFWYYIVFPLIAIPLFCARARYIKVLMISAAAALLVFVGFRISVLFVVWLLGVALLFIPKSANPRVSWKWLLGVSSVVFFFILLFIRLSGQMESKLLEEMLCGTGFFLFCYSLIYCDNYINASEKHQSVSFELAGFSYSLYLIHTPLLCLARGWIVGGDGYLTFDMRTALIFFTVIAVIVVLSYGLAKVTEFHTHKVYKKLGI